MPTIRRLAPADFISLSRVVLAGAFLVTASSAARLTLVAAAGLSDYLDGQVARRAGPSRYGAVIDPAADRVFVIAIVATLVAEGVLSISECLVLMARDIVTTVGVLVMRMAPSLRPPRLEARWSGKVVTALQFVTLVGVLLDPATRSWLVPIVGVASLLSIGDYSAAVWRGRAVA